MARYRNGVCLILSLAAYMTGCGRPQTTEDSGGTSHLPRNPTPAPWSVYLLLIRYVGSVECAPTSERLNRPNERVCCEKDSVCCTGCRDAGDGVSVLGQYEHTIDRWSPTTYNFRPLVR